MSLPVSAATSSEAIAAVAAAVLVSNSVTVVTVLLLVEDTSVAIVLAVAPAAFEVNVTKIPESTVLLSVVNLVEPMI